MDSPRFRTLWISDVHLGFKECKAEFLLDFLRQSHCERLYLVGDLIDFWSLRKGGRWPAVHGEVLKLILAKARAGTRVIYVPGNHDEVARDYFGLRVGDIAIVPEAIHVTADGRRFLVTHGDECDSAVRCGGPLLHGLGDGAYDLLLFLNRWYNRWRRRWNHPYWSLASFLKQRIGGGRRLHRPLRGGGSARGGPARAGRRHLRPYPPRCSTRTERRAVRQRRRLGGKLHRAGGISRWRAGNSTLEPPTGGRGGTGTASLAGTAAGSGMGGRRFL